MTMLEVVYVMGIVNSIMIFILVNEKDALKKEIERQARVLRGFAKMLGKEHEIKNL